MERMVAPRRLVAPVTACLATWLLLAAAPAHATALAPPPAAIASAEPTGDVAAQQEREVVARMVASYMDDVIVRLRGRWVDNFLAMAGRSLPATHPVNDPTRKSELAVVAARTGGAPEIRVVKSSGDQDFDSAASEVVRDITLPPAPTGVLSDDGKVRLQVVLARDPARPLLVDIVRAEAPLEDAVGMLVQQGRVDEALLRVQRASGASLDASLSIFARAWLRRALADRETQLDAAIALAAGGDASGMDVLRAAFARGERLAEVVRALRGAQAEACDPACIGRLAAMARAPGEPPSRRLAAAQALTYVEGAIADLALQALARDPSPAVRAAAILASAKPNGGKGAIYRLLPLLADAAIEVRAAAAAGLVRTGGEAALPHLYLLPRERAPEVLEAMAPELARLSGEASADLLRRFLKHPARRVRVAGAAALAARADLPARKILARMVSSEDPDLRALAASEIGDRLLRRELLAAAGPEMFRSLVACGARSMAADWLALHFATRSRTERAQLLGEWIAVPAARATIAVAR